MNKDQIVLSIKTKIEEHRVEIDGSLKLRDQLLAKSKKAKEDLTKGSEADILGVKNLFGVYEKMKFHKTCVDVLSDLLQEIEREEKSS